MGKKEERREKKEERRRNEEERRRKRDDRLGTRAIGRPHNEPLGLVREAIDRYNIRQVKRESLICLKPFATSPMTLASR
jgi:hypothetical protein